MSFFVLLCVLVLVSVASLVFVLRGTQGRDRILSALFVLGTAFGLYGFFGLPGLPDGGRDARQFLNLQPGETLNARVELMVESLAARLESSPDAPENFESWLQLAQARAVLGQHELAIQATRRALRLRPDNIDVMLSLARQLRQQAGGVETPESLQLLRRVLNRGEALQEDEATRDDALFEALWFLAHDDARNGARAHAREKFVKALALLPDSLPEKPRLEREIRAMLDSLGEPDSLRELETLRESGN